MKKKIILIIVCILLLISALIVVFNPFNDSDSIRFKEEYESLNNDSTYNIVSIDDDNPIKYITYTEAIYLIKKESGIIFFGKSTDNNSRSLVNILFSVAKENAIDTIYYINENSTHSDNYLNLLKYIGDDITIPLVITFKDGDILDKEVFDYLDDDLIYERLNEMINNLNTEGFCLVNEDEGC